MTLNEALQFTRTHAPRLSADPTVATPDDVITLAEAALRLRDAYEAEADALVLCNDHDMKAW